MLSFGISIALGAAAMTTLPLSDKPPHELSDYVHKPDSSFAWHLKSESRDGMTIEMTSQTWHGIEWKHSIVVVDAEPARHKDARLDDVAILYATGGDPNPLDLAEAHNLSVQSGLPVAMLFHIPNQPIEDLWEDDLIAHTFQKCLDTGDTTWPLLFPMAKSAVRAMDALGAATKGKLKRFVVMGASKRGWTTWMTAATGDKRVIGIAPAVYDNLNIPAQMAHQIKLWGHFSPMIQEYTKRDLQEELSTEAGRHLASIVDPYSYLPNIHCRILIVNGSNDPYWTVDALGQYKAKLPYSTSILVLPNQGHVFVDKTPHLRTVGAFARAAALGARWPHFGGHIGSGKAALHYTAEPTEVRLYMAESPNFEFADKTWNLVAAASPDHRHEKHLDLAFPVPTEPAAAFAAADFTEKLPDGSVVKFTLTTSSEILSAH